MIRIRVVKTGSLARAVQAVRYANNKRIIIKHFGSCRTNDELDHMLQIANEWVKDESGQLALFGSLPDKANNNLNQYSFLGAYYTFLHEMISAIQQQIGFSQLRQPMLNDLVIMRLIEPASKLRSMELLESYFGIKHLRKNYYHLAPLWLKLKDEVEQYVVDFAKVQYAFGYDLLLYDVTTLYFETFEEDDLRKQGFSKDSKSQQPQIVVALMVTQEGFPIAYEIFAGNTFEGHTIIPVITSFITKHKVKHFTVVADAAMISTANIEALVKKGVHYIVGARLGNLANEWLHKIDQEISREDGKSIRIKTDKGYLICSYSSLRYKKDKYEMEKQIEKAKIVIEKPSKNKKVKFTKTQNEKITINQTLIDKTTKLLGLKGYYTDVDENIASNQTIIAHYHELYKIEQAFRISKSDLQTRPIFHFKQEPIKLHLLICFMALVISKHIELKTNTSIKRVLTNFKKVTDARMLHNLTGNEVKIRSIINPETLDYIAKLTRPH